MKAANVFPFLTANLNRVAIEPLKSFVKQMETIDLNDINALTLESADIDGVIYDDLELAVVGRYWLDGDMHFHLATGDVINFTRYMKRLIEAINHAEKLANS